MHGGEEALQTYQNVKSLNDHVPFYHINDIEFKQFGRKIDHYQFDELTGYMESTSIPTEGNVYIGSVEEMEQTNIKALVETNFYGRHPIQIGYCNGENSSLNGLEFHKSSEINIACTDLVLLLGKVQEIENNQFDVKNIKAFFAPKGTAIEIYATTLHFAPCKVTSVGFKCIVILPKGTNESLVQPVESVEELDKLLFMKNKWLLAHSDRKVLIEKGAYKGIIGENIKIHF